MRPSEASPREANFKGREIDQGELQSRGDQRAATAENNPARDIKCGSGTCTPGFTAAEEAKIRGYSRTELEKLPVAEWGRAWELATKSGDTALAQDVSYAAMRRPRIVKRRSG